MKKKSNGANHKMIQRSVFYVAVVLCLLFCVPVLFADRIVEVGRTQYLEMHEAIQERLENDEKSLQGKWVLENISAFDENMKIMPFSIDSICCQEISTGIDIQQNEVTFTFESGEQKVEYEKAVRKDAFYFPFYAGWRIVDNKLQLSWGRDVDLPAGTIIQTIVLTYKLK